MSDDVLRRPGDLILDRYLPNATPEEREEAREVLQAFFGYLHYGPEKHLRPIRRK